MVFITLTFVICIFWLLLLVGRVQSCNKCGKHGFLSHLQQLAADNNAWHLQIANLLRNLLQVLFTCAFERYREVFSNFGIRFVCLFKFYVFVNTMTLLEKPAHAVLKVKPDDHQWSAHHNITLIGQCHHFICHHRLHLLLLNHHRRHRHCHHRRHILHKMSGTWCLDSCEQQ